MENSRFQFVIMWLCAAVFLVVPPASVAAPELIIQLGDAERITSNSFSEDGTLAVTTAGRTAVLYDVESRREIRRFGDHEDSVTTATIFADNDRLATGSRSGMVRIWDTRTGAEIRRFAHPSRSRIRWIAYSERWGGILTISENVIRLWDVDTGAELRGLELPEAPQSFAFSPDETKLLTGDGGRWVRIWNLWDGEQIGEINHYPRVNDVAFSPDGRTIATITPPARGSFSGDPDIAGLARTYDVETLEERFRIELDRRYTSWVGFLPDGQRLLAGGASETLIVSLETSEHLYELRNTHAIGQKTVHPDGRLILGSGRLWDATTGEELQALTAYGLGGDVLRPTKSVFSPDGEHLVVAGGVGDGPPQLWELASGREVRSIGGPSVESVAFSADGRWLATGSWDYMARLWDVATGEELRTFEGHKGVVGAVALSADGGLLLSAGDDGQSMVRPKHSTARLWNTVTGEELRRYKVKDAYMTAAAFSLDGRLIATGGDDGFVRLWRPSKRKEQARLEGHTGTIQSLSFSPDDTYLVSAATDGTARIWDVTERRELRRLNSDGEAFGSAVFAADGNLILTASADGTARLWETITGREVLRLAGHEGAILSAFLSADERWIGTAGADGTVRLWDRESGAELGRLVHFRNGTWLVVAPDGRFDTNGLEESFGAHWLLADEPLRPLPLEIFMRDYFEPRLLPRILAGERLPELRDLSQLNRVQPGVRLTSVDVAPQQADRVSVTLEVESVKRRLPDGRLMMSDVHDVRLFRNGQLVAYHDGPVELNDDDRRILTFDSIRLPQQGAESVEFSAYAFNSDGVKSSSANVRCAIASEAAAVDEFDCVLPSTGVRKGRAYVIGVGVNAYETAEWDLQYAAKDAEKILTVLPPLLQQSGGFTAVTTVPLIADRGISDTDGQQLLTVQNATKAKIKAVIDVLAGRDVDAELLASIPNGDELQTAVPEDLIIFAYSSHGYADESGRFFLFPYDIGRNAGRPVNVEMLPRTISSDELSEWLRDVDAGEFVMIIDACHSAASVEGTGFKPGPMASRGLGQLAYDKGMRILASTRADDVAWESAETQQGLLSFALVEDGLKNRLADFKPNDNKIGLLEWLQFAELRVPALYARVLRDDDTDDVSLTGFRRGVGSFTYQQEEVRTDTQLPSLFDFRKASGDQTVIVRIDE